MSNCFEGGTLQNDIRSIQKIGGYTYGIIYASFVVIIFIAAVYITNTSNKTKNNSSNHDEIMIIDNKKKQNTCLSQIKQVGKTMNRLRSIYFVILVHIFDTLTDFLIMLEWYIKGQYEKNKSNCSFPSISYMGCFYCAVIILLFYRVLSAHYVYQYYKQSHCKAIVQSILQFFDISIFFEVYQSHLHQATTDNLSYLSKLEKTFESSPQLILQVYVLMRELAQFQDISPITVVSIIFSLISLSSKVIHDDSQMFLKEANKKHKFAFFSRSLFRVCEISARLLSITLFATYFGANFLIFLLFIDFLTNILLFDHGLLDSDPLNCMSYLLCVMNCGICPNTNN
eukprot:47041_1